MSDEELIEVVKLCCEYNPQCAKCPLEDRDTSDECMGELLKGCLELINRQQAEIERLQKHSILNGLKVVNKERKQIKSEAIKEFAERLKQEIQESKYRVNDSPYARACNQVADWCIEVSNNLVAEMTESPTKIEHSSLCETDTYEALGG